MEITAWTILEARTYVPMAEKVAFVEHAAGKCRNAVQIAANGSEQTKALPDMFMVNAERKARYKMGALVKMYLLMDFDGAESDPYLPSWDDYDRFGESHLINQIERLKTDKEVGSRCSDLLQDFRSLEKMLNAEVYGMLHVQNDPVTRFLAYLQSSTTPESLQKLKMEAEALQQQIQDYVKGREGQHDNA